MNRYTAEIWQLLHENLQVPQQVIDSGIAGHCTLEFTVAPDGTLLSVEVIAPSGMEVVNRAALAALRASHLPAFLPDMPHTPHTFTIEVKENPPADD